MALYVGSSLMHSPLFVCLNLNVLIVDSNREMDQREYEKERTCDAISYCSLALDVLVPKWQCGGGGYY